MNFKKATDIERSRHKNEKSNERLKFLANLEESGLSIMEITDITDRTDEYLKNLVHSLRKSAKYYGYTNLKFLKRNNKVFVINTDVK